MIAAGLRLLVAVLTGLVAGLVTLLVTAAATGQRVLALIVAALVLALCTAAVCIPVSRRRWLPPAVAGVELLLVAAVVGGVLFAPAPSRPSTAGPGTRFWDLPTGSRIAYTRTPALGERRATPVILVHGGPGAPDTEPSPLASALAGEGFDVYDYHQVGAGLSNRLADVHGYTVARHVADLEAIRAAIGADRVVLAGISWGAQLSAAYLAAHPDRVARAVLTSPGTIWSPAHPAESALTPAGLRDQQEVMAGYPRFMLAHVLAGVAGPRAAHTLLPDTPMDGLFEAFVGRLDMDPGCRDSPGPAAAPPAGFGFWANLMTARDAQRAGDPRPALRRLSTPVLVLRGACDYLAAEVAGEYREVLAGAVLRTVDGAGHDIAHDQPVEYRRQVTSFLLGG